MSQRAKETFVIRKNDNDDDADDLNNQQPEVIVAAQIECRLWAWQELAMPGKACTLWMLKASTMTML
jgi:hypothetical protein